MRKSIATHSDVKKKLCELYNELVGQPCWIWRFTTEILLLRRGQKEALLFCGRQFRFVVNNSSVRFVERRKQVREIPEPDNRTEEKEQSESRKTAIQLHVYPVKSRLFNNLRGLIKIIL